MAPRRLLPRAYRPTAAPSTEAPGYVLGSMLGKTSPQSSVLSNLLGAGRQTPTHAAAPQAQPHHAGGGTVIVGDSLGVGTAPHLNHARADVKVGRPSSDGVRALRRMHGYGRVLFDLGTNDGSASELSRSVRQAAKLARGATVYVPIVHGPHANAKNRTLRALARTEPNVRVVHWHAPLSGDGIHARDGHAYASRARQIARALGG